MTISLRPCLLAAAAIAGLTACQSSSDPADPYATNAVGADGGYNPYPGQSGYVSNSAPSPSPSYQQPSYQTPPDAVPEPPPEPDPYAYSAPKTSSSSSSGSSTSSSAPKKKTTSSSSSTSSRYTVVKGDTLYGIARKKGTTVAKIKAASGLSSDLIRPGQVLKLR